MGGYTRLRRWDPSISSSDPGSADVSVSAAVGSIYSSDPGLGGGGVSAAVGFSSDPGSRDSGVSAAVGSSSDPGRGHIGVIAEGGIQLRPRMRTSAVVLLVQLCSSAVGLLE